MCYYKVSTKHVFSLQLLKINKSRLVYSKKSISCNDLGSVLARWSGLLSRTQHIAAIQIKSSNNILPMVPTWRHEALGRRVAARAQAGSESPRVGVKSTPRRLPTWWAWRVPQDMADDATYLYYVFVTGPKIRSLSCNSQCPQFHVVSLWLMAIEVLYLYS